MVCEVDLSKITSWRGLGPASNSMETYVYVKDADVFKACLDFKSTETQRIWDLRQSDYL